MTEKAGDSNRGTRKKEQQLWPVMWRAYEELIAEYDNQKQVFSAAILLLSELDRPAQDAIMRRVKRMHDAFQGEIHPLRRDYMAQLFRASLADSAAERDAQIDAIVEEFRTDKVLKAADRDALEKDVRELCDRFGRSRPTPRPSTRG